MCADRSILSQKVSKPKHILTLCEQLVPLVATLSRKPVGKHVVCALLETLMHHTTAQIDAPLNKNIGGVGGGIVATTSSQGQQLLFWYQQLVKELLPHLPSLATRQHGNLVVQVVRCLMSLSLVCFKTDR